MSARHDPAPPVPTPEEWEATIRYADEHAAEFRVPIWPEGSTLSDFVYDSLIAQTRAMAAILREES